MKVVLYLNGDEGFFTASVALRYANVAKIVLPKKYENDEIKNLANKNKIPISLRGAEIPVNFKNHRDAILISSAFPYKIFEKERTFFKQAVNFHSAILPKYRGRHGSVWAMINDEKELGVSIHEIDESFDNGKILSIESFPIFDEMKLNDIQEEARNCLETALENFFTGKLKTKFKSTENIYWRSRKASDSFINWHASPKSIFCLFGH